MKSDEATLKIPPKSKTADIYSLKKATQPSTPQRRRNHLPPEQFATPNQSRYLRLTRDYHSNVSSRQSNEEEDIFDSTSNLLTTISHLSTTSQTLGVSKERTLTPIKKKSASLISSYQEKIDAVKYQYIVDPNEKSKALEEMNDISILYFNQLILNTKTINEEIALSLVEIKKFYQKSFHEFHKIISHLNQVIEEERNHSESQIEVIKKYQKDITEKIDEIDQLNKNQRDTDSHIDKLNLMIDDFRQKYELAIAENESIQIDLTTSQFKKKQLQERCDQQVKSIQEMENLLETHKSQIKTQEILLQQYEEEGAGFRPMYLKEQAKANAYQSALSELQIKISTMVEKQQTTCAQTQTEDMTVKEALKNKGKKTTKGRKREQSVSYKKNPLIEDNSNQHFSYDTNSVISLPKSMNASNLSLTQISNTLESLGKANSNASSAVNFLKSDSNDITQSIPESPYESESPFSLSSGPFKEEPKIENPKSFKRTNSNLKQNSKPDDNSTTNKISVIGNKGKTLSNSSIQNTPTLNNNNNNNNVNTTLTNNNSNNNNDTNNNNNKNTTTNSNNNNNSKGANQNLSDATNILRRGSVPTRTGNFDNSDNNSPNISLKTNNLNQSTATFIRNNTIETIVVNANISNAKSDANISQKYLDNFIEEYNYKKSHISDSKSTSLLVSFPILKEKTEEEDEDDLFPDQLDIPSIMTCFYRLLPLPTRSSIMNSLPRSSLRNGINFKEKAFNWLVNQIFSFYQGLLDAEFTENSKTVEELLMEHLDSTNKIHSLSLQNFNMIIDNGLYYSSKSMIAEFFLRFWNNNYSTNDFKIFSLIFQLSIHKLYPPVEETLQDYSLQPEKLTFLIPQKYGMKIQKKFFQGEHPESLPKPFDLSLLDQPPPDNEKYLPFWDFADSLIHMFQRYHIQFHKQVQTLLLLSGLKNFIDEKKTITETAFDNFCILINPNSSDDDIKKKWNRFNLNLSVENIDQIGASNFIRFCSDFPVLANSILLLPFYSHFEELYNNLSEPKQKLLDIVKKRMIYFSRIIVRLSHSSKFSNKDIIYRLKMILNKIRDSLLHCDLSNCLSYYRHLLQYLDLKLTEERPFIILPDNIPIEICEKLIELLKYREVLAQTLLSDFSLL